MLKKIAVGLVVAFVVWFIFQWVSNQINAASFQPTDDGIVGNGWAPPLPGPGIVYGWQAPWMGRRRYRNRGTRPY